MKCFCRFQLRTIPVCARETVSALHNHEPGHYHRLYYDSKLGTFTWILVYTTVTKSCGARALGLRTANPPAASSG